MFTVVRSGNRVWILRAEYGDAAVASLVRSLIDARDAARTRATSPGFSLYNNEIKRGVWFAASVSIETTAEVSQEEIDALLSVASLLNLGVYQDRAPDLV